MQEVKQFRYQRESLPEIKEYRLGRNWPVVYILEDGKEAYIGETTSAYKRAVQHYENKKRAKLSNIFIIADEEYNKSATLDIESQLIKYMAGDGKYLLQNSNSGLYEANYYDRERYQAKFQAIWSNLQQLGVVNNDLIHIENSDLFKYSPYKVLTEDQMRVVSEILSTIKNGIRSAHLVSGDPGTGKTIVATFLMKALQLKTWSKNLKIGLVVPMTSLRSSLKRVFKHVKGLSSSMVIGPSDVIGQKYDVLVVDETHRLQRRVNLPNYGAFDIANKKLNFGKNEGTQLDWIMKSSQVQILFYDGQQSIRPADIRSTALSKYHFVKHKLESQMRVAAGNDYIQFVTDLLEARVLQKPDFENYDLKVFENISDLVAAVQEKDYESGLSRLLAGYSWEWQTKKKNSVVDYDIEVDGVKLRWNSVTKDWINSPNAVFEVGCIHTIQGYDLNYAGVIFGREISYDSETNKIVVDKSKYLDFNGKRAITDPKELELYIKNIYRTLMTRGIKGTYLFAVNKSLSDYLKKVIT